MVPLPTVEALSGDPLDTWQSETMKSSARFRPITWTSAAAAASSPAWRATWASRALPIFFSARAASSTAFTSSRSFSTVDHFSMAFSSRA